MTLAQGPGHPAGGAYEKGRGEKSLKATLLNSGTTQGVVLGRGMVGSAVAVFPEPITKPGGGIVWAETMLAASTKPAATNIFAEKRNVHLLDEKTCILLPSMVRAKF